MNSYWGGRAHSPCQEMDHIEYLGAANNPIEYSSSFLLIIDRQGFPSSLANAALTRGTQLEGPEAMQAIDIGVQWPGW
jgi:hypothetical protein